MLKICKNVQIFVKKIVIYFFKSTFEDKYYSYS